MTTPTVDDLLNIAAAPSVGFKRLGDSVIGIIRKMTVRQDTEYMTNQPKVDANGNPEWVVVIELGTNERDPSIPNDDGNRLLYAGKFALRKALSEAQEAAGAKLAVGGRLHIQYVRDDPSQKGSPQKIFAANYQPPGGAAQAVDIISKTNGHQAVSAPAATAAPGGATTYAPAPNPLVDAARAAQVAASAPAPAAPTPSADPIGDIKRVKELQGLGLKPAQINEYLPTLSLDAIKAITGM